MEKQKKQLILLLAILIVAVIAFIVVLKLPKEDEDTSEQVSYEVTKLDADKVTKLSYHNENATVRLVKDGDKWYCEEDKTIEIDADTVSSMINKVASLTSENKIEKVKDNSIYGLDSPSVAIYISDGSDSYTLLIGDYNETTQTYYMCLEADTSTVYTTDSVTVSTFDKTLEDLKVEEETTETQTETVSEEDTNQAETETVSEEDTAQTEMETVLEESTAETETATE